MTDEKKIEVLNKLRKYCAYQERCLYDLRQKAKGLGITYEELEELLPVLEAEDFYDEGRFAEFFAGGKFRLKKWGRLKIRKKLRERQVPKSLIDKALSTIPEEDYLQTLRQLIRQKSEEYGSKPYKNYAKLRRFFAQRGFEDALFNREFFSLFPKNDNVWN